MALTDNILHYWKLDESSGNAVDAVGNTNLTNVGTLPYAAAKINNGANFNLKNTRYFTHPYTGNIPSGDFTLTMWFSTTNVTDNQLMYTDWYNHHRNIYIGVLANSKVSFYRGNGSNQDSSPAVSGAITNNTVYFLAIRQSGTTKSISLNAGTPSTATANYTGETTTQTSAFGLFYQNNKEGFVGMMDEIGVWTRALSDAEITTLYNGGAGIQYPFSTPNTSNFFQLFN